MHRPTTPLSEMPRMQVAARALQTTMPHSSITGKPRDGYMDNEVGAMLRQLTEEVVGLPRFEDPDEEHSVSMLRESARQITPSLPSKRILGSMWTCGYVRAALVKSADKFCVQTETVLEPLIIKHRRQPEPGDLIDPWHVLSRDQQLTVHFSRAIIEGDLIMFKSLLTQGVNPSGRDLGGETFLCVAVRAGQELVVEALLAIGADPARVSSDGTLPIAVAIKSGNKKIMDMLLPVSGGR